MQDGVTVRMKKDSKHAVFSSSQYCPSCVTTSRTLDIGKAPNRCESNAPPSKAEEEEDSFHEIMYIRDLASPSRRPIVRRGMMQPSSLDAGI